MSLGGTVRCAVSIAAPREPRYGPRTMIKLFGNPLSTCTRKVLCTLHETNTPFEFTVIDFTKGEHKQPAHLARQPFGQVPAIDDDGFALYESRAICRYLNQKAGGSLVPNTLQGCATMEQWISVETSNFTPAAMKLIYNYIFFPMQGKAEDPTMIADGNAGVDRALKVLETRLAASTSRFARCSIRQASWGTPLRVARHDTTASKDSPAKPSAVIERGSVTSPKRTSAPASARRACST